MQPHWTDPRYLAGDADRERAIDTLKTCFQDGRINAQELSDRIGLALNARTFGDLHAVLVHLPVPRPAPAPMYVNPVTYQPFVNRPGGYSLTQAARWNGMGLTAFVLGIFGFICGITAIPAIALGAAALSVDAQREDKGFAVAGIAVGAFWIILFVLMLLN
ncbi:DUF1707 and DUF4190 domain-containing protein [Nocardia sp. NPDC057668]|uniref:DUF1707 and DUF4190 domain-containing protein n=1 Tax=Nocardia sp. NPDC057668 TaxID=3346202 RepID=UPI00366F1717